VSKNPLARPAVNGEQVRFVDRLPSWTWDEPGEEQDGSERLPVSP